MVAYDAKISALCLDYLQIYGGTFNEDISCYAQDIYGGTFYIDIDSGSGDGSNIYGGTFTATSTINNLKAIGCKLWEDNSGGVEIISNKEEYPDNTGQGKFVNTLSFDSYAVTISNCIMFNNGATLTVKNGTLTYATSTISIDDSKVITENT